jgi:hypothetical protein
MKKLFALAALVLCVAPALAQTSAQAATFHCGGVGVDEQQRMKADAPRHSLLATFATTGGDFIADVNVEIRRGGKVVLQGHCNGPLMLADLAPAGSYEVVATARGRTQRQEVAIGGHPASVTFTW